MSDFTANLRPARRATAHGAEYGLYFGLIFLLGLPAALVRSAAAAAQGDFSGPGPIGRARMRAREITPRIFDA